jgi:hypothetical protein
MKRDDYHATVTDASGNGGLALQRPGFRLMDGAMSDAKEQAYREYEIRVVNAWRHGAVGQGEGPLQIDREPPQPVAQGEMTIEQVYAAYAEELRNAWRKS